MKLTDRNIKNFLDKFEEGNKNDCWDWKASRDKYGYGNFTVNRKNQKSHRVSYAYFIGEIPSGAFVLHSCDNPSCVNPNHLRIGTHQDNMDDKVLRNRQFRPIGNRNGMFGKSGESHPNFEKTPSKKVREKISETLTGRYPGEKNPSSKLKDIDALNIRRIYKEGRTSCKELGKTFSVSRQTIFRIINRISWKHI